MRLVTMLPEINALPGAEGTVPLTDRQGQAIVGEDAADMGRHIIRPLGIMVIRKGHHRSPVSA